MSTTIDLHRELAVAIRRKWAVNRTWMSPAGFEAWIRRQIGQEDGSHTRALAEEALRWAGPSPAGRVRALDIGAGEGGMVLALRSLGASAAGLDRSAENVSIARLRARARGHAGAEFVHGDATSLPWRAEGLDLVLFISVLEHVDGLGPILSEAHRVLRPGGVLFATVPNPIHPVEPHVRLPIVHWLPSAIRRPILDLLRREKARTLDHLDSIRYWTESRWSQAFDERWERLDARDRAFRRLVEDGGTMDGSLLRAVFGSVARRVHRVPVAGTLVRRLFDRLSGTLYLVARKRGTTASVPARRTGGGPWLRLGGVSIRHA